MWIFAEDFEGCTFGAPINLAMVQSFSGLMNPDFAVFTIIFHPGEDIKWCFTTFEQAQAAYEKIKEMLKDAI